jgi:hypothetical protein
MAHLVSLSKSAQSVFVEALFPLPEWARGARWLQEHEEISKELTDWSSFAAALRESPKARQVWQEIGASTVCVAQARTERPEGLYTFVADSEVFDDYDLMVSSALSLDPDEAIDLLQQFDGGWLDAPDRAQEKFCVGEEISDEMIATGMLEHDFVVQMPPVREYTLRVRIKSIEKATPHIVGPEDI